jgi:hypothetical protein
MIKNIYYKVCQLLSIVRYTIFSNISRLKGRFVIFATIAIVVVNELA